jgi:CheY-like chemotaxis protein
MAMPHRAAVLIVDDRPDNILAMEAVLRDSPEYDILTASSGPEAIELVKAREFALVLLDIQMPHMDGYQTAKEIKQLDNGRDVPIIMVTAIFKEDPHILRGYEMGAIDYLAKPFNPDILRAKVGIYANLYIKSRQVIDQNKYLREAELLLEREATSRKIFDTLPVGVIVVDEKGNISQINKEAAQIWGGIKLVDVNQFDEYKGWWAGNGRRIEAHEWAAARALEKGETSQYEIIHIEAFDGSKKTILNSATPIRNELNEITGSVAVLQDITHQQNIEAAILSSSPRPL